MTTQKFFDLSNVTERATETTVQLFNSCRPIESDNKGKYYWKAIKPTGTGVVAEKVYIKSQLAKVARNLYGSRAFF